VGGLDLYGKLPYVFEQEIIMPPVTTTARLEARISAELHATLKRAAALQDRTVTDFVIAAVQEAAQRAIQQAGVITLALVDQERFASAMVAPPPPNAALKRAFARRRKLIAPG
jgi:uncharacterized protein (DUF1778 family)